MEEDIRKQGALFLQQQRFGKKWKRVWCVLYRESSCSISRLEFFECKDGGNSEKNDKTLRKQQEHKKVIRLADCIRVSEVDMDGCPRETGPFLIETTEKIYVFAADRMQLDDWTHKLCEIAFPMSWSEGVKRGSLQRGNRVDEDEGMEQNSLYSERETVRDFRVCVRRTEASDRCRLKGDGFLRADVDALHLLDKTGDILYSWPYRYLRRFGRDKSTFSFEAGRRCDSGEGGFEFDTKQGNFLFQAVEAAINLQRISLPQRQTSGGGQVSPETPQDVNLPPLPLNPPMGQCRTPPLPQNRSVGQAADGVYSMVTETPTLQMIHHKDKESSTAAQHQQRPPLSRLEPPVDKLLTGVKSLTLDTRGVPVPRKNQVKMISSCPLPHADPGPSPGSAHNPKPHLSPKLSSAPDQMYSQIGQHAVAERGTKREKRGCGGVGAVQPEPEYSLPFDTIAINVMSNIVNSQQGHGPESGADPLYDSIDEMKIRNIFLSAAATAAATTGAPYEKVEHIYDEPEGCAATATTQKPAGSLYDDPEEMRGDAWRIMGTPADPKGHEYPYNPRVDDYAVPKRAQRAHPVTQSTNEGEDDQEEEPQPEEDQMAEQRDSPYNNVMVKMA
ncbi:docking protein 2 [Centropristis striata]|uniref:docking protein 2 n=1 Tax=Centropristis striata TaxID=184440 RepID=UPI0027DF31E8|nr:docking protein 2 [Centropristis striata]